MQALQELPQVIRPLSMRPHRYQDSEDIDADMEEAGDVGSDDDDVKRYLSQSFNDLKAELKKVDPKAKRSGKGVTKKKVAKDLGRAARRKRRDERKEKRST
ncbi:uncharacterized protein HMPREF1541_08631 [Cyphellophora europaea CBS 101466]|uniref:Uncharacterized protein n=1 Tax=Cyphellophora europaea (strain CBS 101466) TaxID=1220924 RepID=W2RKU9_CYPE1|nr:uncharacterized protein HMPREF1541_08631 [Cyphellophora europaea CBS 101466]ETN36354.1 hypothetical protein HMPREF1541_08631 [Cyphellophora europaea CBS 101466]